MKRRSFGKIMIMAVTSMVTKNGWSRALKAAASDVDLPSPVTGLHSVEKCLNSRVSAHSGYSGTLDQQILSNALWAASRPPLLGVSRFIYAATPDGIYNYDPVSHKLILQTSGNKLSENKLAFEIGVATDPEGLAEDAGAALHWAHLAILPFLENTSEKPVCCPKDSAYQKANTSWNLPRKVHLINCYGKMSSASGFKTELVAVSSDNSLPAPSVDGTTILEDAMQKPIFGDEFSNEELTLEEISQLAWAAYGCTPHDIVGGKAGLTVASWNAMYYLTGRIYIVRSGSVDRYHMRLPSGQNNTRDHRLEQLTGEDRRAQLRSAVPRISQNAPVYFVFCADSTSRERLLEAGYCGSSALLQATSMNLQGHYCGGLSDTERTAIQQALGINNAEKPLLLFAAGKPVVSSIKPSIHKNSLMISARPNPFVHRTEISIISVPNQKAEAAVFDLTGKHIRTLVQSNQSNASVIGWDGKDHKGRAVPAGTYVCKISAGSSARSILLHKKK
jgi:hypothetical protein